ncbi:hypothetical protein QVD99_000503 [Batrachochytrium dendrobatidis]|nr:hypothetical protein QVD99_000503 [Batrachochytrium dendrobatidis]
MNSLEHATNWSGTLSMLVGSTLSGDRIQLPPSILSALYSYSDASLSPLTFMIQFVSDTATNTTHGCVREFTAPEGSVIISPFLAKQLLKSASADSPTDHLLNLTLVSLPKCHFAHLAPLDDTYLQIPDIKYILESHLRQNHSTLTCGETLSITQHSPLRLFQFLIVELKPASACLCIDTDMEVNIHPVDPILAEKAVKNKILGQVAEPDDIINLVWHIDGTHTVPIDSIQANLNHPIYFRVHKPNDISGLRLIVTPSQGDVDCFVSLISEHPSMLDHDFYNVDMGMSNIWFNLSSSSVDVPFVYIAVVACTPSALFSIKMNVESSKPIDESSGTAETTASSLEKSDNLETCTNCGSSVPSQTLLMHTAYCQRNNQRCTFCNLVMRKSDFANHWHCDLCKMLCDPAAKEKHKNTHHTAIVCDCGLSLHLPLIANHKQTECPNRFIVCRFCHLRVRAGKLSQTARDLYLGTSLTEHESDCGARTIKCIKCDRSVQLKDIQTHAQFHEFQKTLIKLPPLCTNLNCARWVENAGENVMEMCRSCFAPFWSSSHDPGFQKLAQKLMSKYHQQLTHGCQKADCYNQYCATSMHEQSHKGALDATEAAVQSMELFKRSFFQKKGGYNPSVTTEHYLCISDSVSSRRRYQVETMKQLMKCSSGWGVKAMEANGDDLEQSIKWLESNAPKPE